MTTDSNNIDIFVVSSLSTVTTTTHFYSIPILYSSYLVTSSLYIASTARPSNNIFIAIVGNINITLVSLSNTIVPVVVSVITIFIIILIIVIVLVIVGIAAVYVNRKVVILLMFCLSLSFLRKQYQILRCRTVQHMVQEKSCFLRRVLPINNISGYEYVE